MIILYIYMCVCARVLNVLEFGEAGLETIEVFYVN